MQILDQGTDGVVNLGLADAGCWTQERAKKKARGRPTIKKGVTVCPALS